MTALYVLAFAAELAALLGGLWLLHRAERRRWAREDAEFAERAGRVLDRLLPDLPEGPPR